MVDMHMHSYWSDGECSPLQLVKEAQKTGLTGIVLTDHNNFWGKKELEEAGRKLSFPVSAGTEISCREPESGRQLHLLAYGLSESGMRQVDSFIKPLRESLQQEMEKCVSALEKAGYPVSLRAVYQKAGPGGGLYKQMVMELLMEAGLCGEMYGPLYRELFKTGKNGNPPIAGLHPLYADPEEAVRCVRAAGGFAVLAHPGQYGNFSFLPCLVDAGLSGIEARHPLHSDEDTRECLMLAERYGLKVTGGSDYHGKYGEGETPGEWGADDFPF